MDVAQLAERIGIQHGVDHRQARELVDDVFRALAIAAHIGDDLTVPGIGRISVSHEPRPEYPALDELQSASLDLLQTVSRVADAVQSRGDEIDRDLAQLRQLLAPVT